MIRLLQGALTEYDQEYQERAIKQNKKNKSGVRGMQRSLR